MTILLVVLILFALIIVHELGHFIAAKISGVKVKEFGVGYPPTALRLAKIGDTEYTLNWIPFGGFVRLFGDEGQGEHGRGSFADASRGKQAVILIAGITMNIVAGWLLFTVAYAQGIPRVAESAGAGLPAQAGVQLFIAEVIPGSPADSAGIHGGDEIVAMEDTAEASPAELTPDGVKEFVVKRGGKRGDSRGGGRRWHRRGSRTRHNGAATVGRGGVRGDTRYLQRIHICRAESLAHHRKYVPRRAECARHRGAGGARIGRRAGDGSWHGASDRIRRAHLYKSRGHQSLSDSRARWRTPLGGDY